MTTPKHTPGPWTATHHGIYSIGTLVATAEQRNADNRAADARLIAAAPELLEACKTAELIIRVTMQSPSLPEEEKKQLGYRYNVLMNAITKAEGR